jgi:hypothetical protein
MLNEDSKEEFKKLLEMWCDIRKCHGSKEMKAEMEANSTAIKHFKELELFGFCVKVKVEIVGYALANKLNKDTCLEHFEKANTQYQGAYQYIVNQLALMTKNKFKFINREQDLGIEGLRRSKQAYKPVRFVKKYNISR